MKNLAVHVDGRRYSVIEAPGGILKADLCGYNGWQTVWSTSFTQLVRQIRIARDAHWIVVPKFESN